MNTILSIDLWNGSHTCEIGSSPFTDGFLLVIKVWVLVLRTLNLASQIWYCHVFLLPTIVGSYHIRFEEISYDYNQLFSCLRHLVIDFFNAKNIIPSSVTVGHNWHMSYSILVYLFIDFLDQVTHFCKSHCANLIHIF